MAASLIVPTVDRLEPGIQSLLLFWEYVFGVYRCDLILLHFLRVCCSSPCGAEYSCYGTLSLLCMEGIVLFYTKVQVSGKCVLCIVYACMYVCMYACMYVCMHVGM